MSTLLVSFSIFGQIKVVNSAKLSSTKRMLGAEIIRNRNNLE